MESNNMDSNKENVRRSKIPVPLARSDSLKSNHDDVKSIRNPLKSITAQCNNTKNSAGTSKDRHVTRRNPFEHLDWNYRVFKDSDQSTPVTIISPPLKGTAEKKVKNSLRRAHTRGLQGLTPAALVHNEVQYLMPCVSKTVTELVDEKDFLRGISMDVLNQNYTGDTMQYLLSMEKKVAKEPIVRRAPRSCVINWIIKVDSNRGNPAVVQSTCWYFDTYLSSVYIPVDRLQLTAAACYWLATKLHGSAISSTRLVKCSSYAFSPSKLMATEMNVLKNLHFSVQPVIPYDFIPFLSWWCDTEASGLIESAATFICQCGMMVSKNLCEEYPSVIAVACIQNALILLDKKVLMNRLESCPVYKKATKKSKDILETCAQLRVCVRTVASITYDYKSPVVQYSVAPHYVAPRIMKLINCEDVLILDKKFQR